MSPQEQKSTNKNEKIANNKNSVAQEKSKAQLAVLSDSVRSELNELTKAIPSAVTILQSVHRDLALVVAITLAKSWIPDLSAKEVDMVVAIPDGRWSIDQLREEVLEKLRTLPISRRVVVIDRVDEIEGNVSDILLKAIEEPGENTVFILIATSTASLNPTIRGRIAKTVTLLPATSQAREKLLVDNGYSSELARQAIMVAGEHIVLANVLVENPDLLASAKSLQETISNASIKPVSSATKAIKEIDKIAEALGKHLGGTDRGTRAGKRDLVEKHINQLRQDAIASLADGVDPDQVSDQLAACDAAIERMLTHAPLSVNLSALHISHAKMKRIRVK